MAAEKGLNVLFKVSGGSPTSYVAVAGQQSGTFSGDVTSADITDKTNSGWSSTLQVLHGGTVTISGVPIWPDTDGWDVLRTAWQTQVDVDGQIVLNSSNSNYTGVWQVTGFEITGEHTDATKYSVTLQNNGVLTYSAS